MDWVNTGVCVLTFVLRMERRVPPPWVQEAGSDEEEEGDMEDDDEAGQEDEDLLSAVRFRSKWSDPVVSYPRSCHARFTIRPTC